MQYILLSYTLMSLLCIQKYNDISTLIEGEGEGGVHFVSIIFFDPILKYIHNISLVPLPAKLCFLAGTGSGKAPEAYEPKVSSNSACPFFEKYHIYTKGHRVA